jgi:hypothetical protein
LARIRLEKEQSAKAAAAARAVAEANAKAASEQHQQAAALLAKEGGKDALADPGRTIREGWSLPANGRKRLIAACMLALALGVGVGQWLSAPATPAPALPVTTDSRFELRMDYQMANPPVR